MYIYTGTCLHPCLCRCTSLDLYLSVSIEASIYVYRGIYMFVITCRKARRSWSVCVSFCREGGRIDALVVVAAHEVYAGFADEYTRTHAHTRAHAHTHAHTQTLTHTHIHIYTHTCICTLDCAGGGRGCVSWAC